MPRGQRAESPTGYYHWINRGVNQKKLFHFKDDFKAFLDLVQEYKERFEIDLFHYCLMTNHIHLLIKTNDIQALFRFSYYVQRRYAYYYCKAHKWRGQVFQRMYKSLPIDKDTYLLECGRYIERNPLRAKLVKSVGEWPYSSYSFYATGQRNNLITVSPAYLEMASETPKRQSIYQEYVNQERVYENIVDQALMGS
jgi:putative transposase